MRRHAQGHGFWLSVLINMAFRGEWLIPIVALIVLHFIFPVIPLWAAAIPAGLWLLHGILVTALLSFAVSAGDEPTPYRPNANPYSTKNANPYSNGGNSDTRE